MEPIYCPRSRSGSAHGHFLGWLDEKGRVHLPSAVTYKKDFVSGAMVFDVSRFRGDRPPKPADSVDDDIGEELIWESAWEQLSRALRGQPDGAEAEVVLAGTKWTGKIATGSVSVTGGGRTDERPRGSQTTLPTPCSLRCHCKAIRSIKADQGS